MAAQESTTNGIPKGTGHKESNILDILRACNARNFDALTDVALHNIEGGPIDDKSYLMERIIGVAASLPLNNTISDTLTNKFLGQLWDDLSHPPDSYLGYDYAFRKADGSNNNIMWPHIGKAGQPYARSVRPQRMHGPRPDPGVVYESILKRKEFRPHPNKISSVLFYVASIIIHDCFHTSHKDYAISETSSYLDLAPLYGSNETQQLAMRTMKDGKLKPDCFSDSRILGFPPGVGVLLIMFNRFHNNVVENLAKIDDNGRFSGILDPARQRRTGLTPRDEAGKPPKTPEQLYDEALFQTGRLVTTGLYINIVLQDYVRTILGLNRVDSLWNLDPRAQYDQGLGAKKIPEAGGNQVSAEFSLVYRWHSCVSQRDEAWTNEFLKEVFTKYKGVDPMKAAADWADDLIKKMPNDRPFEKLQRQADGRFSDDDLCGIWVDSVDDVAGAFGAAHVPSNLKFVEVLSMIQARSWNLASLNEFREYFKLAPHKTFESINPDPKISEQLKKLYGHPDNVEIYPGIVVESAKKAMDPGSGLCASWTTSRAILADAVALVRGDRFYTVDYTPNNLTNWGFQTASYDRDINWGGVLYKLVLNAFPNHIAKNSIYAHFPLVNPPENKAILGRLERGHLYNFDRPQFRSTVTAKASGDLGTAALTDPNAYTPLWTTRSAAFAVPKAAQAPAAPKMSFADAVMSIEKWKAITTKFYTTQIETLWAKKQYELGGYQQIDVVADVLNPAHVSFITSVLGIKLPEGNQEGVLANMSHIFESAYTVDAQPRGLVTVARDFAHWFVGGIGSTFSGSATKEEELGKAALAKLKSANGTAYEKVVWQNILPTSALIFTALSRSSASGVEHAIADTEPASILPVMNIAVKATTDAGETDKGQVVVIDLSTASEKGDTSKVGSEVVFAQQVAEIANKAIIDVIQKSKGVERVPGPQGRIKKISFHEGDVRYLNEVQSDYVTYPLSLKVRWKK